jgi:mRNA-degrading endonuclease RelE of RelBE toxin-antitoxin system
MEFIETHIFTKRINEIISDDEYRELQAKLAVDPEAGALIPGCQGLRKLRWAMLGAGKRGGLRVIYYWYVRDERIYMLFPYKKSERKDLTKAQEKMLIRFVKEGVI